MSKVCVSPPTRTISTYYSVVLAEGVQLSYDMFSIIDDFIVKLLGHVARMLLTFRDNSISFSLGKGPFGSFVWHLSLAIYVYIYYVVVVPLAVVMDANRYISFVMFVVYHRVWTRYRRSKLCVGTPCVGDCVTITPQSGSESDPGEPIPYDGDDEVPTKIFDIRRNPRLVPGVDLTAPVPDGKLLRFKRLSRPKVFTDTIMPDGTPMPYCRDGSCAGCDEMWETDSNPFSQDSDKEYYPEFDNPDDGFYYEDIRSLETEENLRIRNSHLYIPSHRGGGMPSVLRTGGVFSDYPAVGSLVNLGKLALNVADFWRRSDRDFLSTTTFVLNLADCLNFNDMGATRKFLDSVKGFFNVREIKPQSDTTDWIRDMFDQGKKAARKHLPFIIKKILALIAGVSVLPSLLSASSGSLPNMVGHIMKKKTTTKFGVISDVMDTLTEMVSSGIDWVCEEHIPPDVAKTLMDSKEHRRIQLEFRLTMSDVQRRGWEKIYPDIRTRLKAHYAECFAKEEYTLVNMIDRERELLDKAAVEVSDTKPSSCQQTMAINFCGDSSTGKSMITKCVADIVGFYYQGEPYDANQKLIIGDTKFWDGAHNGIKVMYLDDLDADKLDGESRCDRGINGSLCSLLINLVNRISFTPPMAQAQDKGKIHPNPHLLIISSNENNEFGDIRFMRDPTAGARRLISVRVKLKEEFRLLSERGGVDPYTLIDDVYTKSPWLFDIRRYDVASAVAANRGLDKMKFYPNLYKVDKVRLPIRPTDIDNLSEDERLTLSVLPDADGFHSYIKRTENVDFSVLREWVVAELDRYQDAGDVIDKFEDKNLAAEKAFNLRRTAAHNIQPQSGGDYGLFGLGFYEHTNDISRWPLWAFDGVASSSGASVVTSTLQYSELSFIRKAGRWFGILFRLFVQFPALLFLASMLGIAPSGFRTNLRVFYTTCFVNACVLACVTGRSQSFCGSLAKTITNTYIAPFATRRLAGLSYSSQFSVIRRVAFHRAGAIKKHKRTAQLVVGGIFAGMSLYAIKSAIEYYRTLSDVRKMEFFPQSEQKEDVPAPEPQPEPDFKVSPGGPDSTTSALRARGGVIYKGNYGGNPKDLTRGVKAYQANPCMSYSDVIGNVQNNIVRIYVQAVDSGKLATAKSIDGKTTNQFGLIVGSTHTTTAVLMNNHALNPDADYYKFQVCWKSKQILPPVIVPRAFIALGTELPDTTMCGVTGGLDVALVGIRDMGSVKNIVGCFMQEPSFAPAQMPYLKRMVTSSLVGTHCHQEPMNILSGDYHGLQRVDYAIGNMPAVTLLGACVEGTADRGMCGLPYVANRAIAGIHQGASGAHVYAAPLTQSVITSLMDMLQQKALPGTTNVHIVVGSPLLADDQVSSSPPIVKVSDEIPVHRDSVIRRVDPHSKYTLVCSSGSEGVSLNSSMKKNPHRRIIYKALPASQDVARSYNTPSANIHDAHVKMFDKTSAPTFVEPFTLRVAYENVLRDMTGTFMELALADSTLTGLGPCDMDTALDGFNLPLAGSIELTTSAGSLRGKKNEYFEKLYDEKLGYYTIRLKRDHPMSPYIVDCVRSMIQRARLGITSTLSRKVVPKDEARPCERGPDGQIVRKVARLIHAGELVELIVFRMYFLPVMTVLGMDPGGFGHAVGLNPSEAWGELYKRLHRHPDVANFATDYSSFDLTISVDLLDAAVNLLIAMTHMMSGYTDEHRYIMRVICYDLCNPIYNIDGTWVRFTGSNSSGNPLTTMLNCLVNHLVWNQVWVMWSHDRANPAQAGLYHTVSKDMPPLSTVMSLTCLGDDFLGAVKRSSGFTQVHAVDYAARLGFTLTAADDKAAAITDYALYSSFLKRDMIVYDTNCGELVLAPLAMSSLLRPFVWGEWNVDMIEHFAGLIKGMLIELVQHGPEVYGEYVSLLQAFVSEFQITYHTSDKRADIREPLSSYFSDQDFRPWEDRITEIYGKGEQIIVQVDTARRV